MPGFRAAALSAAILSTVLASCAGGAGEGTERPGGSTTTAAVFPPAPAVPSGPLPPGLEPVLDALAEHPVDLDPGLVGRVGRSGDARLAWLLVDLLRFQFTFERGEPLIKALRSLTDYAAENDEDSVAWVAYADALLRWDIPAPPGYFRWKRAAFVGFNEGWAPFFDEKADLDWRQVAWGGTGKDRIPTLVDPKIVEARRGWWLPDDDVVFGVMLGGEARAYPQRVMEVHELVNDTLGGRRIGVPYCTLCGTAIGYFLDGLRAETLELRTSGLLQRSNKLMYDARTESLFDQFKGVAVAGPLRGLELVRLPVLTTSWGEWKAAHPDTTILARDAGTGREYGPDPLKGRDDAGPIFPIGRRDGRLPMQEPVLGVVTDRGVAVAFPVGEAEAELRAGRRVAEAGVEVGLEAGGLVARVSAGGPQLPPHQSYWFAWSQFHPGTLLWRAQGAEASPEASPDDRRPRPSPPGQPGGGQGPGGGPTGEEDGVIGGRPPHRLHLQPVAGEEAEHVGGVELHDLVTGGEPGGGEVGPQPRLFLPAHPGEGDRDPGPAGQAQGGGRVVGQPPVALPGVGEGGPQAGDGHPSEGGDGVEHRPHLEPREAEPGPRAHHAGPHGDDGGVGPGQVPGHGQGGEDGHGLVVAAEGVPAGDGGVEKLALPQGRHQVRHGQGQAGSVRHHVGQAGFGSRLLEGDGHGGELAVEAGGHHRHPVHRLDLGEGLGVLLGRADVGLEARVAGLDHVPRPPLAPGLPLQVPVHDVPAAGAEAELDGGRVHHHPVADGHRAGQLGEAVSPLGAVTEVDLHPLEARSLFEKAHDDAGAERGHGADTTPRLRGRR